MAAARHANVKWDDLDAADVDDPLMVPHYVVEIMEYMRELEVSKLLYFRTLFNLETSPLTNNEMHLYIEKNHA